MCFIVHSSATAWPPLSHDPLRLACRPRGVEDVEGVGGLDGNARRRLCDSEGVLPFEVATWMELGLVHRPLHDDAALGLRLDHRDRGVQERLVGDDAPPRSRTKPRRTFGVASSMRLASWSAAKPPRTTEWIAPMRARQHRYDRFRDHRRRRSPGLPLDPCASRSSGPRDKIAQSGTSQRSRGLGDRRVVDQRELVGSAALDVPVEGVVTRVQAGAR